MVSNRQKSTFLAFTTLVISVGVWPLAAKASFYNEEYYSYCVYNWIDECPSELQPGKGVTDEAEEALRIIKADVEPDDKQEEAIDSNRNLDDGYETFNDPDGSSTLYSELDGDGDGQTDFLINTAGDSTPEIYWDPDNGILGGLTLRDIDNDGTIEFLFDSDGDGELDAYYDPDDGKVHRIQVNIISRDIDEDKSNEFARNEDLDDSNGFEVFSDPDESSSAFAVIDGDGDGRQDFLISTGLSELPEAYWDPDRNLLSAVIIANTDDDEALEFMFDSDGDGIADKYYDRETNRVYDFVLPGERRFTSDGFGGALYQGLGNLLRRLPQPLASALPLLALWLLAMLGGLFLLQTRQELRRVEAYKKFLDTQRRLSEEKDIFMQLISHYLRTPLTIISGFTDLATGSGQIAPAAALPIKQQSSSITQTAEELINRSSARLGTADNKINNRLDAYKRRALFYLLPLILFGLTTVVVQFALVDFRVISISTWWLILLIGLTMIAAVLSVMWLRRRQIKTSQRKEHRWLVETEENLDQTKNAFIEETVGSLDEAINGLETTARPLNEARDFGKIQSAISDLRGTVDKLSILSHLKLKDLRRPETKVFSIYDSLNHALEQVRPKLETKRVKPQINPIEYPSVDQNEALVNYMLANILDNAADYSPVDGVITMHGHYDEATRLVSVTIADQGPGIPLERQQLLFKAFSRTEGDNDFTHQGLGLSLHLDQLVAHYLGGEVSLSSSPGRGTQVSVTLPVAA